MIVRMKIGITGSRNTIPWPAAGETLEVPDHEAADLISQGYAETADGSDPEPWPTDGVVDGEATVPVDFAVPDGNIDEVLAWVGHDHERADAAIAAEESGKGRKTLIEDLTAMKHAEPHTPAAD